MTFVCQLCGMCCSTMGEIINIREEISPFHYRIWYTTTGEERVVTVDPDKRELFQSAITAAGPSLACPFLRIRDGRDVICTVHLSRPELCRQYSCFRILVLDPDGRRIGRVLNGTRYFSATDAGLYDLWQRECTGLAGGDEMGWEEKVCRILTRAGYRIIR